MAGTRGTNIHPSQGMPVLPQSATPVAKSVPLVLEVFLDFSEALFKFRSPVDLTLFWTGLRLFLWQECLWMGKTRKICLRFGGQSPVFQTLVNFFLFSKPASSLSFRSAPPPGIEGTWRKPCPTSTRRGGVPPVGDVLSFGVLPPRFVPD